MTPSASKAAFADVVAGVDSDALEREILSFWDTENIFAESLAQTEQGPLYIFYDGPPYATGKPHYGHILQSAIKDTVLRYKTMRGYHVPRRVGWDCHGLPVETLVEKELGITSKQEIERLGIAEFNAHCRAVVFRYIKEFTTTLQRIGRWADYDNAYATLNQDYMESEWWVFKQLWDKGLVYKAFRSTPYCIRCATPLSNFEVSSNYQETQDTAIYVLLKVVGRENLYLAVWTTTPWTLPGNVAVAINPDLSYVVVEHEDKNIIVAQERVSEVFDKKGLNQALLSLQELTTLSYEPLYNFLPAAGAYRVVESEHVTSDDGTGLVHIAPAFGEEDFVVAKNNSLPTLRTVDPHGNFIPEVTLWAGKNIFAVNQEIIVELEQRGLLLRQESFRHSYPFCWRCDQPLIYYALDTWFIRVEELKERMLKINEKIDWTPKHVQHGRFGKGIVAAPDWAVSRNRYWSVPLPIWECDACSRRVCLGSVAELQELSGQHDIPDLHRPLVDTFTWPCGAALGADGTTPEICEGTMRRTPEVLDVWFDSGAMPYAQWHYPFERKEFVEQGYPADFIAESIEMTRAWFYVLHVLATALTQEDIGLGVDQPAFKHAIASGLIFAEDGKKLSKKLKNYPEIEPTLERYGADTLRFYLLASTSLGEPYRFSEKDLKQVQRAFYMTLWNVYSFFVRYANTHAWRSSKRRRASTHLLDQWIRARLAQFEREVTQHLEEYTIDQAARAFLGYSDDLSNWYVRRSRSRFQKPVSRAAADEAFATLYEVLTRTAVVLAPFMPFVSEAIYRNLAGQKPAQGKKTSVHLAAWPKAAASKNREKTVLEDMRHVREIVSQGLALRAQAGIKVRQPLAELAVSGKSLGEELTEMIRDEVNVKAVSYQSVVPQEGWLVAASREEEQIGLDTRLTPALRHEGYAREIIRYGQVLRKEANYALNDRIIVKAETTDQDLQAVLAAYGSDIREALQAETIEVIGDNYDVERVIKIDSKTVTLAVRRAS
ncbi:MAG: isoleucine--tRNA ligase [Candidatus Andersenbacteria bacterium]